MQISVPANVEVWETFLQRQPWSPFLQSFAMGEVYRAIGEEPVRVGIEDGGELIAVAQAIIVPARRGKHLMVQYGPVLEGKSQKSKVKRHEDVDVLMMMVENLKRIAKEKGCSFVRVSPFWEEGDSKEATLKEMGFRSAPLHLLAEHIWYLDLRGKTEEEVLMGMRKTTRNLIRRAEKEGVTVTASDDPVRDLPLFFALYEETRKRHGFVPYPETMIREQVTKFENAKMRKSENAGCALYIAWYRNEPVAASVHMTYGGETSYHHGASTVRHPKIFASYLLQWTAIRDAIKRGDRIYNFWGIAPVRKNDDSWEVADAKHPFAGVTLFKTGFGGQILNLVHCMDLPLKPSYYFTRGFEMVRKWRRGF